MLQEGYFVEVNGIRAWFPLTTNSYPLIESIKDLRKHLKSIMTKEEYEDCEIFRVSKMRK